jgi:phosphatidylglycerophosphatase A
MKFLAKLLASGFGTGYSPVAPGTAGSALAAALIYLFAGFWAPLPALAISILTYFLGVACCSLAEKEWGHDNGRMVIDEIAGMFLAMSFCEVELKTLAAAFFIFRFFDIVKPPPASNAERLPSGWGVMTDDMVAGAYAAILMMVLTRWM